VTPERLLSPPEVADWLGVPVATLYAQRYHGDPPGTLGMRVGRHLRFDRTDIQAWLDFQKHAGGVTQSRGQTRRACGPGGPHGIGH
jgi:predicted DNA-binding transcriptional regulator AlpA